MAVPDPRVTAGCCALEEGHVPIFPYSHIPIVPYSHIHLFPYSLIPLFPYSHIHLFPYSHIPIFPAIPLTCMFAPRADELLLIAVQKVLAAP